ncbi:MAG TPA: hypothetical protein VMW80_00965, partial [Candidatus Dormibacteraeota bacterium]|nr:hypothetical protein [Candidatus Dormibacteraeota bacterium]
RSSAWFSAAYPDRAGASDFKPRRLGLHRATIAAPCTPACPIPSVAAGLRKGGGDPMVYKASDDETSEENERVIRGFKWVPVFDIASTDGADLPTVCQKLTGDDPAGLYSRLADVAHSIGFAVENAELPGTVNGDCTHTLHRIRVEITNSPA